VRTTGILEERIHTLLASRRRRVIESENLTSAAVLLPLFTKEKAYHVLLTKRTEKVKTHRGEISFPGGVYDPEDQTLEKTALRESFEEIGLREEDVKILGCLDDVETITHYRIRPFVGVLPYPYSFALNDEEIDEIIEVPLSTLLRDDFEEDRMVRLESGERPIYRYYYGKHVVWGATAAILKQFLDLIRRSP
jgi:8-oxo-dGTP pyrophosphatase MutT (NUDIX family)